MIRTKWTLSSFHLYLHISKSTLLYTNEDWLLMKDSPRCLRIKQNKRRSSMGEQPSFLWLHDYLKPSILMLNILFNQSFSFILPSKVWHISNQKIGHFKDRWILATIHEKLKNFNWRNFLMDKRSKGYDTIFSIRIWCSTSFV